MALQINLLHEEISEQRQRQRDPLKLGLIALGTFGAILFLYYGWKAYETLQIKGQLSEAQAEWGKVEPKVTAAQKRADELRKIIDSTKVLDGLSQSRFYWAPLLATVADCVSPNVQLISLSGGVADNGGPVSLSIEGIAAAHEPRAGAEKFRETLEEQLEKQFSEVHVDFHNLEDLETAVTVEGVATPSARFVLSVSFKKPSPEPAKSAASPAPEVAK